MKVWYQRVVDYAHESNFQAVDDLGHSGTRAEEDEDLLAGSERHWKEKGNKHAHLGR